MLDNVQATPILSFDLSKIEANARALRAVAPKQIACFGVTKGCGGSLEVAGAMIAGGLDGLADSRVQHLLRLRAAFPTTPLMALRQPTRGEMSDVITLGADALVSDLEAIRELGLVSHRARQVQSVLLMVEAGEGREGILPGNLKQIARTVSGLSGIDLAGVAVNTGCRGGVVPDKKTMVLVDKSVRELEAAGVKPRLVSAGNSSCWRLLEQGALARSANHLRVGELILLGRETTIGEAAAGFHTDAVSVGAEVLEVAKKQGDLRLIVAIGCQDIGAGSLDPVAAGLTVERLTSDHAVLLADPDLSVRTGDILWFAPSYLAMQALASSPHVTSAFIGYNRDRFNN